MRMQPESASQAATTGPLRARDVMTAKVISVGPDEPTRAIAQRLLDNEISAVPVVNSDGTPIGIVSEGDLIGRSEAERLARRDWWLSLITDDQLRDDDLQARLQATDRTAWDVMTAPLVTVAEDTYVDQIAQLLTIHQIKRVPVLHDGRIVGIVSRADLLRVVAAGGQLHATPKDKTSRPGFLSSLFGGYHTPAWQVAPVATPAEPLPKPGANRLAAGDFRHLVEDFQHGEVQHSDAARRAAAQQRRERTKELIDAHVFDEGWRQMLHRARAAAESGQTEYMPLQFPSQLCIDGGRAINVAEHGWPAMLRGEPAEIYLRWERELKPHGFALTARVLDFPGGKPGDVGLVLTWGA
jgi:CBS domain-containing protein